MPVSIHLADASFSKYCRQALPPYVADCLGYWLFGGTEAKSLQNRLVNPAAPVCSKIGTVTVNTNSISVTNPNANGYRSGIVRSGAFTMACVFNAAGPYVSIGHMNVSGGGGGTAYEESELVVSGGVVGARLDSWITSRAAIAWSESSGWGFCAFTYADPVPTVYRGLGSGVTSNVGSNYSQSATDTEFRICDTGRATGGVELGACLYYNRALTAGEVLAVYNWLKLDVMAARGLTLI